MRKDPIEWIEQDLKDLTGQPESFRLEFKSSRLLGEQQNKIAECLSTEISAFANSEGGHLIIGIEEAKLGKTRVAKGLDEGTDPTVFAVERLQQIIESNVRPMLPGIRIRAIRLTGEKEGRVAFIVKVPQGTTAYQASDWRYYSRSEYQALPMPDHEVRLRMMRGRIPQARMEVTDCKVLTAEQEFTGRSRKIEDSQKAGEFMIGARRKELEKSKRSFDELSFHTVVNNIGEVTIRDFLLAISFEPSSVELVCPPGEYSTKSQKCYRFAKGIHKYKEDNYDHIPAEKKIFPGDRWAFPDAEWRMRVPVETSILNISPVLRWTVYLDDAQPSTGEIHLIEYFSMPPDAPTEQPD